MATTSRVWPWSSRCSRFHVPSRFSKAYLSRVMSFLKTALLSSSAERQKQTNLIDNLIYKHFVLSVKACLHFRIFHEITLSLLEIPYDIHCKDFSHHSFIYMSLQQLFLSGTTSYNNSDEKLLLQIISLTESVTKCINDNIGMFVFKRF